MSTVPKQRFTPEEYLARERLAKTKSEYYAGEIFAMSGSTREHNVIAINLSSALNQALRDRPCEVYSSDMRVRITPTGLYTYPDVSVVCGEPRFLDEQVDTLLNPTVLVEVLSESTMAYDRGTKSKQYRQLPSLKELLLVAQDSPEVEKYVRQPDGTWSLIDYHGLDAVLELTSIEVRVPLAEIYRRIEFPSPHTEGVM